MRRADRAERRRGHSRVPRSERDRCAERCERATAITVAGRVQIDGDGGGERVRERERAARSRELDETEMEK